ncbi:MAG TPA: hypothetical protein VGI39_39660, partial [Polyangiaceae bacterium]
SSKAVNAAITKAIGAFEKKIETSFKGIKDSLDGLAPQLDKVVEDKLQALKSAGGAGGAGGAGDGAQKPPPVTESPEYRSLLKTVGDLQKKVEGSESREKASVEAAKNLRLRQRVAEGLAKRGVDPARIRLAVGQLIDVDKKIRIEGEGEAEAVLFKDSDGDVELDRGLDDWFKTDEAKIYLPPRGAAGSGDRGGGRRPATQTKKAEDVSYGDVGAHVLGMFPNIGVGGEGR